MEGFVEAESVPEPAGGILLQVVLAVEKQPAQAFDRLPGLISDSISNQLAADGLSAASKFPASLRGRKSDERTGLRAPRIALKPGFLDPSGERSAHGAEGFYIEPHVARAEPGDI